jgi:hypothetical protein
MPALYQKEEAPVEEVKGPPKVIRGAFRYSFIQQSDKLCLILNSFYVTEQDISFNPLWLIA